jgi:glucosamine-6-phosphate deaminase
VSVRLEVVPAGAWADRVADALLARLRAQPGLRLCLPTGDTPTPLYGALARRTDAPWAAAEIVLLDEYLGLPPGDPALAGDRLRRELIDLLPEPPAAYHAIDLEADPEDAAARHDAVAAAGLDLTLVGLGANGHVGFNEPGSGPDSPTAVVELAHESRSVATGSYGAGDAPQRGITLGMARVLASRELWLLVTGARKAGVLARALEGPEGDDCPGTYLRRHPALTVFADEAAAAQLTTAG